MNFALDASSPIYLQLLQHFRRLIVSGRWPPGSRIASVRDLAIEFEVNPNTVQRALAELERDGLARSERTSGRFISEDSERIEALRRQLANEEAANCLRAFTELGYDFEKTSALLSEHWKTKRK